MYFINSYEQQNEFTQFNNGINNRSFKPHSKFSEEEDERLKEIVTRLGDNDWVAISQEMPGRNARQCKERWSYYLSPSLNTSPWSEEEDKLLLSKQRELGSKWVKISKFFDHRTDAMVKNRYQVLMRKMKKGLLLFPSEQTQTQAQTQNEVPVERSPTQENVYSSPATTIITPEEDNIFEDFEFFYPDEFNLSFIDF
ncbi:Myb-like DNA-binding domain containing protein [Histomonas meleagridis]|uniref:Myb-like DNA-binding domain containing protein n=1 Tax=Histomonas meleagridis TaxID=135588 RepID=UPI003559B36F|nr:Myb-like DNA-binding domain containing protein [Histomonas meleagridis]KAH0806775.1 Myb-like DNA-binding domain containing protein [Histomonas meleagridis]